jgi:hypothetical protein
MPKLVFWIDVDNTLLDNDRIKEAQNEALLTELGPELSQRYWDIYEEVRQQQGVVDIPLTLHNLRERTPLSVMDDITFQHVHSLFNNFPFQEFLFPHVLETLQYLNSIGTPVIVSDGDKNYQAEKIFNSNIAQEVDGRVLLFVHKQEHLAEIERLYPADHWAIIDDKPQILVDVKKIKGDTVTTVFVKQGKYAQESFPASFVPDISVDKIGDVRTISVEEFLGQKKVTH